MSERSLRFFDWEFERIDMLGLLDFIVKTNPKLHDTQVAAKAYQIVGHGDIPEEIVELINVNGLRSNFEQFRKRIFRQKNWLTWQAGIGGVFYKNGQPDSFVPMMDMEITSTNDLHEDTKRLEEGLKALNVDGSIIRSGDSEIGGYFIVGHNPLPYTPEYWRFMGKAMMAFSDGVSEAAICVRELGYRLTQAENTHTSIQIADEILAKFESTRTGTEREGLLFDPRWVGHKLKEGTTILRQTPGKSYEDRPLQVAEFY